MQADDPQQYDPQQYDPQQYAFSGVFGTLYVRDDGEQLTFTLDDGTPAPDALIAAWVAEWPADRHHYRLLFACAHTPRAELSELLSSGGFIDGVSLNDLRTAICRSPHCDEALLCQMIDLDPDTLNDATLTTILTHKAAGIVTLAKAADELHRLRRQHVMDPEPDVTFEPVVEVFGLLGICAVLLTDLHDTDTGPITKLASQLAWLQDRPNELELVAGLADSWTGDRTSLLHAVGMLSAA